ncbi:hypothetical protein HPB50_023738 [Hyalomma asiaticum]|uniref:Uncharacterized protein n=1 Tax=Hyalomma asiaticum TaxID=266040 RepID=A0ACB7SKP7_HYAAI|nr:hypothetical protein HPB50_023738 [Hyalomma asiaticum]
MLTHRKVEFSPKISKRALPLITEDLLIHLILGDSSILFEPGVVTRTDERDMCHFGHVAWEIDYEDFMAEGCEDHCGRTLFAKPPVVDTPSDTTGNGGMNCSQGNLHEWSAEKLLQRPPLTQSHVAWVAEVPVILDKVDVVTRPWRAWNTVADEISFVQSMQLLPGTIGFVHRECLERWIQRTADPQCQVCHFRFAVRKQLEPAWRLLSNVEARRPVLGYMVLCAVFALGIAFIFTLAWLYAVCLPSRVGDKISAVVVVMLTVQNVLWLYFPFVSFRYSYKAYKKWREGSTCLKLVLSTDQTTGPSWFNLRSWRIGGGPREPVLVYVSAQQEAASK